MRRYFIHYRKPEEKVVRGIFVTAKTIKEARAKFKKAHPRWIVRRVKKA